MTETLGLAETINALRARGYTEDFNLPDHLVYKEDDLVVDQVFRFDVMSDPADQSVLYAIHSLKTGAKGYLVNSYGVYTESLANQKLSAVANCSVQSVIF